MGEYRSLGMSASEFSNSSFTRRRERRKAQPKSKDAAIAKKESGRPEKFAVGKRAETRIVAYVGRLCVMMLI